MNRFNLSEHDRPTLVPSGSFRAKSSAFPKNRRRSSLARIRGEARVHERARLMRVAVARQSISPLMQLVDLVRTLTKLTLGGPVVSRKTHVIGRNDRLRGTSVIVMALAARRDDGVATLRLNRGSLLNYARCQ